MIRTVKPFESLLTVILFSKAARATSWPQAPTALTRKRTKASGPVARVFMRWTLRGDAELSWTSWPVFCVIPNAAKRWRDPYPSGESFGCERDLLGRCVGIPLGNPRRPLASRTYRDPSAAFAAFGIWKTADLAVIMLAL